VLDFQAVNNGEVFAVWVYGLAELCEQSKHVSCEFHLSAFTALTLLGKVRLDEAVNKNAHWSWRT